MAKQKTGNRKLKTIKCHHCNYKWAYKGKSRFYMTCPRCYYKVSARLGKK